MMGKRNSVVWDVSTGSGQAVTSVYSLKTQSLLKRERGSSDEIGEKARDGQRLEEGDDVKDKNRFWMILPVAVEDVKREVKILRALSGNENVV
ncbi:putative non-specific serine/threonine protein kinase [Helianthus annuus]|nr:putative non-specific serine/threonine protein kinase [Helianthus annuus]KAJ0761641.1 putative non-specific serine/threonine protein kinase [Helianthus annuus]